MVLLLMTFCETSGWAGGYHPGDIYIGESVSKLVHVHKIVVDALVRDNLPLDPLRNWLFLQRIQKYPAGIFQKE